MDFITIKEKAADVLADVKDGLSIMDRFVVNTSVMTKTFVTDRKTGKRVYDTEDGYTREFSLFKAIIVAVFLGIAAVVLVASLAGSVNTRKKLRSTKKELKRIKKICDKNGVVYQELPF